MHPYSYAKYVKEVTGTNIIGRGVNGWLCWSTIDIVKPEYNKDRVIALKDVQPFHNQYNGSQAEKGEEEKDYESDEHDL